MFKIVLTGKCNGCPCFELDGMAIIADSGVVVEHTYFCKNEKLCDAIERHLREAKD